MRKFLCMSLFFLLCGSGSMAAGTSTGEIAVSVTVLPIHKVDAKDFHPVQPPVEINTLPIVAAPSPKN